MFRNRFRKQKLILSSKISNLIQLLVSIFSLFYQILPLIYWQIYFEKYVHKHLIWLLYNFYFIFRRCFLIIQNKNNSQNVHPKRWFWKSTLRSNSVIIHRRNVSYVSNESWIICPEYCILSSTTIHSRSLPLKQVLTL